MFLYYPSGLEQIFGSMSFVLPELYFTDRDLAIISSSFFNLLINPIESSPFFL